MSLFICLYKKINKDLEVHWLVGRNSVPILKRYGIDKIYTIDSDALIYGNVLKKIASVFECWRQISFKIYDAVYLCHRDYKYRLLTLLTYKKRFAQLNKFQNTRRILEYINLFSLQNDNISLNPIRLLPKSYILKRTQSDFIVVLALGGVEYSVQKYNKWIRQWPIENYVDLAKCLINCDYRVILTGDKNDLWVEKYFKDIPVENYIGKTDINSTIDLYASADCIVTVDSGPMHLASLSGSNIIILFGPTDPEIIRPPGENVHIISIKERYKCSPCYDGKNYMECRTKDCLKNIKAIDVLQVVNSLYREKIHKHE